MGARGGQAPPAGGVGMVTASLREEAGFYQLVE